MTTDRDSRLGFNGTIAYVTPDVLERDPRHVSTYELTERPTGAEGERTLYVTRSAYWAISDLDEVIESNYRSLMDDYPDMLIKISVPYGTALALDVTDLDTDEDVQELAEVLRVLDDEYPLYDEQDYSELQAEHQAEYLTGIGVQDFRTAVGGAADRFTDEQIVSALWSAMGTHDYFGDWDGTGFCAWDDLVVIARANLHI